MANLISFLILLTFLWGRTLHHKNLRLHIFLMLSCLVADLALVLSLAIVRQALSKVSLDMSWLLMVHVPIAVVTVALYFPTAWTGFQLWRGKPVRSRLRLLDKCLTTGRVLTFLTSLLLQMVSK